MTTCYDCSELCDCQLSHYMTTSSRMIAGGPSMTSWIGSICEHVLPTISSELEWLRLEWVAWIANDGMQMHMPDLTGKVNINWHMVWKKCFLTFRLFSFDRFSLNVSLSLCLSSISLAFVSTIYYLLGWSNPSYHPALVMGRALPTA